MRLQRLLLDPRLDGLRLRFALVITVMAGLIAYVAMLDGVAAHRAASEAAVAGPRAGARHEGPARATLAATTPARNTYRETASQVGWDAGTFNGSRATSGVLSIGTPAGTVVVDDKTFDYGAWQAPWVTPGHGFTELVPSWNATTPKGTYLSVQVRARTTDGRLTSWQNFGRWTTLNFAAFRSSASGSQADGLSTVATDTLKAASGVTFSAYTLKVRVARRVGTTATPAVRALGAVASQLASSLPATSAPLLGAKSLAVPAYSQMTHRGQYPEYGGGGQAWCSPTSLSMVLAYYGVRPTAAEYAWVDDAYADPWVDEVARRVFDFTYDGAGNWPFNTGYAGSRAARAAVTRLASLRDAERFIARGIPLVASISFSSGQLTGAPISSTAGHLVVISGFTSAGNVIVNDPAASSDSTVRRTYKRSEFEAAWQRKSHGLVYAVRDAAHTFPTGYGLS
ncbi:membrane protein [Nocardioides phosphati]|uniref:Membrane protein n=1 Tax=Nocardioides phosphati TaxID=1867775 RepID=A0ABQ2NC38_9ACTN|nr:C39 family peptidase [Nocardioides phosphati]GGO92308.1 membrane protein [Nocardioides phosphati]